MKLIQRIIAAFQRPVEPPKPEVMQIYSVGRAHFKDKEQWCALSPAGWPLYGFGEDRQTAVNRVEVLNEFATKRITEEKAARAAQLENQQRPADLRVVPNVKMEA